MKESADGSSSRPIGIICLQLLQKLQCYCRVISITQCIHIHHLQQKCPQKSLLPPFLDRGVAFSILIISREIDPKKSICFASLIWEACDWHVGCYSNFSVGILDFSILPIPLCTAGCLTKLTMIESLNDWKPPRDLEINKMYTHSHAKTKWKYYVQYVTDLLLQQQYIEWSIAVVSFHMRWLMKYGPARKWNRRRW